MSHYCNTCDRPITSCECEIRTCPHGEVLGSDGLGIACYQCLENEIEKLKEANENLYFTNKKLDEELEFQYNEIGNLRGKLEEIPDEIIDASHWKTVYLGAKLANLVFTHRESGYDCFDFVRYNSMIDEIEAYRTFIKKFAIDENPLNFDSDVEIYNEATKLIGE